MRRGNFDREVRTEIDSLNGYVARESGAFGLQTPYNDALAKLIKGREHRPADRSKET